MKKIFLSFIWVVISKITFSQVKGRIITDLEREKDSVINTQILHPMLDNAVDAPNWDKLKTDITSRYDSSFAERALIRGKIFYYFGKDWKKFNENLTEYTEKFESLDNAKIMNANAAMILKYSDNKSELEKALKWSESAVKKHPDNEKYNATRETLKRRISELK